jgi:LPS-assembly protein
MRKAMRVVGLCLLVTLLFTYNLPAQSMQAGEDPIAQAKEVSSWRLRADHFTYDERQGIYSASGRVSLRSQDQLISADRVQLDGVSRQAILEGNVRIEQGKDWLESERALVDLEEETGTIEHGRGFLAENHFYFSGEIIEKLGPQTYHVKRGSFTTCDGESPSWHFRTTDLRVTLEGYGFSRNTRFHLGPVPVLYSPYLAFPAKRKRQSGFLLPRFALGDLRGYDVNLPFFWAISESTDATFYGHYMSKRGLMSGTEFRYAVSKEDKGVLRLDYLRDQESSSELRDQNFESAPGLTGVYRDRWWLRSKQDFSLPLGVRGNLDLDFVSDPDYLRIFKTGFSSWEESDRVFRKTFGRGLINDESVTTRESFLLLNKTWAAHSANAELHYFQNLNDDGDETTLQQLPVLTFSASRQPLLGGPFFYQGNAGYVNFWRREGTRGHRLNLNPRLSLPLRRGAYLQLEPFVGILETAYLIEHFDEPAGSEVREKTLQSRELLETGMEASTDILRIFRMGGETWTKTKHTLRPQILYEYRPKVSQDKFPFFDDTDRVSSRNRLTYSLTNFFVGRLDRSPGKVEYQDFARLEFSQFYDIKESEEGLEIVETSGRRPFSNIFMQLDLTPQSYLNLTYKSEWSIYDDEFKRHDVLAKLWDQRGDNINVDYRRELDDDGRTGVNEIDGRISVNLWGGASVHYRNNYSFIESRKLKTEYRFELQRQCWGLFIGYTDEPDDKRFMVGFTLLGVGGLKLGSGE